MRDFARSFRTVLLGLLDRPMWMLLLFSILISSTVYMRQGVWDLPVAVIDLDHSSFSRELTRRLDATPKIAVQSYNSLQEARHDLAWRRLFSIIIIPKDLQNKILRGEAVTVPVYGDATSRLASGQIRQDVMLTYSELLNQYNAKLLMGAGFDAQQAQMMVQPVKAELVDLFNPGTGFAAIVFPGLLIMLVQHTLLIASIRVIISMHSRPSGRPSFSVYLGAVCGLLPIWFFLSIVLFVLWPWLLGYRQIASIGEILLLTLPFLIAVLGMGKFLTECLGRVELVYLSVSFVTVPVMYLSGTMWPLQSMPDWVRAVAYMLPSTWATKMIAGVNQMGISLTDIQFDVLMLLALGLFYTALGVLIEQGRHWWQKRAKLKVS